MFIRLGDFCEIRRGASFNKSINNEGNYEVINHNRLHTTDRYNRDGKYILISKFYSKMSNQYLEIKHGRFYLTDFYYSLCILNEDIIDYNYLFYLLQHKNIIKEEFVKTKNLMIIDSDLLKSLKINILPIKYQFELIENVNDLNKKINDLESQSKQMINLNNESIEGHMYLLHDWVDINKLNFVNLSLNPNALSLLEKNLKKIHWSNLSSNPNALFLLEKNMEKIDWSKLSANPNAIYLLERHPEKIDWKMLSSNPNAIHILENNLDKICWEYIAYNPNAYILLDKYPEVLLSQDKVWWFSISQNINAIKIIENNMDKINWIGLSWNSNALHILKDHPDKIHWSCLCGNPKAIKIIEEHMDKIYWYTLSNNPNAIHLLENNINNIDWNGISFNPNANHLLEKNRDKINWSNLSLNPSIFKINYEYLKNRMNYTIEKELIEKMFNPSNINKFYDWGFEDE